MLDNPSTAVSRQARDVSGRVTERLQQLSAQPTSRWITPLDLDGHRSRVDESLQEHRSNYTYPFAYLPFPFAEHLAAIEELAPLVDKVTPALSSLLANELDRRTERGAAHATATDETIAAALAALDGTPSSALIQDACDLLAKPVAVDEPATLTSEEAARRTEARLRELGVTGWTVELADNLAANMSVSGARRLIRIRRTATFSDPMVRRLLVHEVDGHVTRWEVAQRQPEPLAAVPMGRTVPTEEGLALWREQQAGVLSAAMMRIYAARVIAVDHARERGLLDVARRLLDLDVPRQVAIDTAIRTKRGLRDPNVPGGTTKDWGYLGGLHLISNIAAADPDGIHRLEQVKWASEHLPLVRELQRNGHLNP